MYPPVKRLRTNENEDEVPNTALPVSDDFEMTDDELLFSATQAERQIPDYYQDQPVTQNPSRLHFHPPVLSTQSVLQPLTSGGNRTLIVNRELELERKLLMKESQICILEKNIHVLNDKSARLTREKCQLQNEHDTAASAREQRMKSEFDICKSQLVFNERERNELQTRYHGLEARLTETNETNNRLLREVTRRRTENPSTVVQQQPVTADTIVAPSSSHRFRLLQPQLTDFAAYELLRSRSINNSSTLQIVVDRIQPRSITQHIWQTLVDLLFLRSSNQISITKAIPVDLTTMTAFYQMINETLQLFYRQQNGLISVDNDQQQQPLTHEQLMIVVDACSHFLSNTIKSTESLTKQDTVKKHQEVEPMDDSSSQRAENSQAPTSSSVDPHSTYYTAKGQCLTTLKYLLSHAATYKFQFELFTRLLSLYTFHFKTRPSHESERRKAFCAFLISLLDQQQQQQHLNPYQLNTAIISSVLDASPDDPSWLCAVPIGVGQSAQRCLCSTLIAHLDALVYFDRTSDIELYTKFLSAIHRLQLSVYDNGHFRKMELDNGQCPGSCWSTLFITFGRCLSRFLLFISVPSIKEQIFKLAIKFVKILILFSLQLQPTTCLPQQPKELQLYANPSLWRLYEIMLLYRQPEQTNQSTGLLNKQVLDDQLYVFGYIHGVLESGGDNHGNEMK